MHSFLLEEYPALGYELTVKTAAAGAGIGTEIRIINSSNVAIALVKYQNKYWTHNDSAIRLCEILGIEPFIKADGKPGVAIKCEDFASTFIYALIDSGEDFAINDDRLYIYRRNIRPAALPVDRVETAARIGSAVELRDNQREIIKFYLAK